MKEERALEWALGVGIEAAWRALRTSSFTDASKQPPVMPADWNLKLGGLLERERQRCSAAILRAVLFWQTNNTRGSCEMGRDVDDSVKLGKEINLERLNTS